MNIRDLKYIVAVAETQHFGKAADRCHVSQPTLSGQIKKLEQELGVAIFERSNRAVAVTDAGKEIIAHARQLIEQADAISQLARAHQDPLAGPLRLGAIPTLSPYLMPLILAPLKSDFPQLRLVLSEELTEPLVTRLLHHEIDAALLATPVDEPGLDSIALFKEPFWLAHPTHHALADRDEISTADLDDANLLLLSEGHCLARQAMEVCHIKQRSEQGEMADLRAASLETLLQLVAAGFGSTLVPVLAVGSAAARHEAIQLRPLNIAGAYRQISLVYRSSFPRMPALEALCNTIRDNLPTAVELSD